MSQSLNAAQVDARIYAVLDVHLMEFLSELNDILPEGIKIIKPKIFVNQTVANLGNLSNSYQQPTLSISPVSSSQNLSITKTFQNITEWNIEATYMSTSGNVDWPARTAQYLAIAARECLGRYLASTSCSPAIVSVTEGKTYLTKSLVLPNSIRCWKSSSSIFIQTTENYKVQPSPVNSSNYMLPFITNLNNYIIELTEDTFSLEISPNKVSFLQESEFTGVDAILDLEIKESKIGGVPTLPAEIQTIIIKKDGTIKNFNTTYNGKTSFNFGVLEAGDFVHLNVTISKVSQNYTIQIT